MKFILNYFYFRYL